MGKWYGKERGKRRGKKVRQSIGKKQKCVIGAHNKDHFIKTLKATGRPMEELLLGDPIPHSTILGIYEQSYTVSAYDGRGNFLGYKRFKNIL